MRAAETYSAAEISAVTGASVRAVYKALAERLPQGLSVQHDRQQYLTRWGAVCFVIDREMPRDVPVPVRRQLYTTILERQSAARVQHACGILSYVVDVKTVAARVDGDLARYRNTMGLIVEDASIQGGAATFRGTRILVHQIADLLTKGADEAELCKDYPRLTPAMLAAALVYARAHPRRGRPKAPTWHNGAVVSGADQQREPTPPCEGLSPDGRAPGRGAGASGFGRPRSKPSLGPPRKPATDVCTSGRQQDEEISWPHHGAIHKTVEGLCSVSLLDDEAMRGIDERCLAQVDLGAVEDRLVKKDLPRRRFR